MHMDCQRAQGALVASTTWNCDNLPQADWEVQAENVLFLSGFGRDSAMVLASFLHCHMIMYDTVSYEAPSGVVKTRLPAIDHGLPLYKDFLMMLPPTWLILIGVAQAFPWDGARPTNNLNIPLFYQDPPKPTGAAQLVKRQEVGDQTCAWENGKGSSTFVLYCRSQNVCATNSLGGFGCCDISTVDSCPLHTACIDSTALASQASRYGVDDYAVSCTNSQLPNCITKLIELSPVVTAYLCGSARDARTETYFSTDYNATIAIAPTYYNAGFDSYTTPVLVSSTQSSTRATTTSTTGVSAAGAASSTITSTSTPTPTPTPVLDSSGSSSPPVGAIVGGTVGGVAVIAGVALLAFFLHQRSKRQQNNVPPPMQQPQALPAVQYPQSPASGYGYPGPATPQQPYQPTAGYYSEKGPMQNTVPMYGTPETKLSHPSSPTPERMSNVPPYSPTHELG